jgi:hypothetical protein
MPSASSVRLVAAMPAHSSSQPRPSDLGREACLLTVAKNPPLLPIALQGAFQEHINMLARLRLPLELGGPRLNVFAVRTKEDLEACCERAPLCRLTLVG